MMNQFQQLNCLRNTFGMMMCASIAPARYPVAGYGAFFTMPQEPLEYESVLSPRVVRPRIDRATIGFIIVVFLAVLLNMFVLIAAEADPGFGAWGILWVLSPIANAVLLILCLMCAPIMTRHSANWSIVVYYLVSLVLPMGAAGFNFYFVTVMRPY